jgi:hypothetical protein
MPTARRGAWEIAFQQAANLNRPTILSDAAWAQQERGPNQSRHVPRSLGDDSRNQNCSKSKAKDIAREPRSRRNLLGSGRSTSES